MHMIIERVARLLPWFRRPSLRSTLALAFSIALLCVGIPLVSLGTAQPAAALGLSLIHI